MPELLDPTALNAWRGFITAHARLIETIDRELAAADCVPLNWYDVLVELVEAPENRLRMSDLARKVVLSKSGLTRLVDKLEKEGLLNRVSSPEDGRGAYAVLTESGRAALRKAWSIYARGIQTYFAAQLGAGDAEQLTALFARILTALNHPD